jgi:hypothetical protein
VFSIDGVPENFSQYRINADWKSIESGLKIIGQSDCYSVWKYIIFRYNQTNIEQAKRLSQDFGIDTFQTVQSDRFDETTQHLVPDQDFLGSRYQSQIIWKKDQTTSSVDPECYDGRQHFITADGYYTPCCYYADHRFYYKSPFGKQKDKYNIHNHTLSQLLTCQDTLDLLSTVHEQSCCHYNCPKVDQKS